MFNVSIARLMFKCVVYLISNKQTEIVHFFMFVLPYLLLGFGKSLILKPKSREVIGIRFYRKTDVHPLITNTSVHAIYITL